MSQSITRSQGSENGIDFYRWTLTIDGEQAAILDAHTSGLILTVATFAGHERQGFARELYETADADLGLLHIPAWGRTFEGSEFADAMGGQTMDDEQAAAILGLDLDEVTGACYDAE